MPIAASLRMKIASPLGQGGTSGGFTERQSRPTPALRATPPREGISGDAPLHACDSATCFPAKGRATYRLSEWWDVWRQCPSLAPEQINAYDPSAPSGLKMCDQSPAGFSL